MITIHELEYKSVHLQCLNEYQDPIENAFATGFILNEDSGMYLYTCWHVVTGFNMHHIEYETKPTRKFIELSLQKQEFTSGGETVLGGIKSFTIPLYNHLNKPNWIQNKQTEEHPELNNIGIKVPQCGDIVKIKLPDNPAISIIQKIEATDVFEPIPFVGSKMYVVGFPYGFSSLGQHQPRAIVLTRFIAAFTIYKRPFESLLDGPGAPGMSGSPVFLEDSGKIKLFGVYTGTIYPDNLINQYHQYTQLGTVSRLSIWHHLEKEE